MMSPGNLISVTFSYEDEILTSLQCNEKSLRN